jgi:ATP-dependent DNA ligase
MAPVERIQVSLQLAPVTPVPAAIGLVADSTLTAVIFINPAMSLRARTRLGLGFVEPCLPSPAKAPPSGPGWLHEIKHDGFRMRRDGSCVRLFTRHGNDFTSRFPLAVDAVTRLPAHSFLLDGEAIVIPPPWTVEPRPYLAAWRKSRM